MIREHDLVALTADKPEHGLRAGDVGTVVLVYPGGEGYAVEFVDHRGETVALLDLRPGEVRPVTGSAIYHVRERA